MGVELVDAEVLDEVAKVVFLKPAVEHVFYGLLCADMGVAAKNGQLRCLPAPGRDAGDDAAESFVGGPGLFLYFNGVDAQVCNRWLRSRLMVKRVVSSVGSQALSFLGS